MEQKKTRKIIVRFIIILIIVLAEVYGLYRFELYNERITQEAHEKAIQWYIDNNKSGYEDFSTYEEYEEFIENGGTIEGRENY